MPIQYQILCAAKKTIKGKLAIVQIGGRNPKGEVWSLKIEQVKEGIKNGDWEFFMNNRGTSIPVQLVDTTEGTVIAALENGENLLFALPNCPD